MRVYFAAPLFSEAELRYNERVCGMVEGAGHSAFLPQRDGFEGRDELYARDDVETVEDAMEAIFELDRSEVVDSDVVTAILDGQVPDEGVAIEMGIAHEHDIPVIGLKTDRRIFAEDEPLNAMVFGVLDRLVETPTELVEAISEL